MEHHDETSDCNPERDWWLHLPRAGSGGGSKLRPTCWRSFVRSPHVVGRRRRPRGKRPGRASGGRPAALHVTDDTARHLRYASRAKREADVSLSHLAPWSTTMASSATRWVRWRIKS